MRRRALIIATNRYDDPQVARLRAPAEDASGLRDVLANPRIGGFDVDECLESSVEQWRHRIGDFFLDADSNDLLLLYISGHGVKDKDGKLYFVASNTRLNRLLTTGMPSSFVQDAVHASRSRRVLMIFDTCFSGAFVKGFQHRAEAFSINGGEYFQEAVGTFIITATSAFQYALEDDVVREVGQSSLFSRHLIYGLRTGEADLDGNGLITPEELFRYVAREVRAESPMQQPQRWGFEQGGDFIVAWNQARRETNISDRQIVRVGIRGLIKATLLPDDFHACGGPAQMCNEALEVADSLATCVASLLDLPASMVREYTEHVVRESTLPMKNSQEVVDGLVDKIYEHLLELAQRSNSE